MNNLENINKNDDKNFDSLLNKGNNEPIQNIEKNDEKKISLKISNLDGKEFTFNESLNFKSNFKFDKMVNNVMNVFLIEFM